MKVFIQKFPTLFTLSLILLLFQLVGCEEQKIVTSKNVAFGYKEFWKDDNFNGKPDLGESFEDQNNNLQFDRNHNFLLYELDPKTGLYLFDENNNPVLFTGTVNKYFIGGQKMYERNYLNGLLHGKLKRWTSMGILILECSYFNGQYDGRCIEWYPFPVDPEKKKRTPKPEEFDGDGFRVPRGITEAITTAAAKFKDVTPTKERKKQIREWILDQYQTGSFKVYNWGECVSLARATQENHPTHESNLWMIHAFKSVAKGEFYRKKESYYKLGEKVDKWAAYDPEGEQMWEEKYEGGLLVERTMKQ